MDKSQFFNALLGWKKELEQSYPHVLNQLRAKVKRRKVNVLCLLLNWKSIDFIYIRKGTKIIYKEMHAGDSFPFILYSISDLLGNQSNIEYSINTNLQGFNDILNDNQFYNLNITMDNSIEDALRDFHRIKYNIAKTNSIITFRSGKIPYDKLGYLAGKLKLRGLPVFNVACSYEGLLRTEGIKEYKNFDRWEAKSWETLKKRN